MKVTRGPWELRWIRFEHKREWPLGSSDVQLDIPYVRCPEEREYVPRLSTHVVLMKVGSGLPNQVNVYTGLDRLYKTLLFHESLGGRWHGCDFESRMPTAFRPAFPSWQSADMFAALPSIRGWLFVSVRERPSVYKYCHELIFPLPPLLALFPSQIDAAKVNRESVGWIDVS